MKDVMTDISNRTALKIQTFMKICKDMSVLSHDPKYQVASAIITSDFREICAIGYNGDYRRGPNERKDMRHAHSGFLHSEENALLHLSVPYASRSNLILMCTHMPCTMCAKRIVNSNIPKVIYDVDYIDEIGHAEEVFKNSGVKYTNLESLLSSKETLCSFMNT